jgi:hypothetical protein
MTHGVAATCTAYCMTAAMSSAVATGNVMAAAGSREAMAAPAVPITPVGPGADAKEDAVIEVAGAVIA